MESRGHRAAARPGWRPEIALRNQRRHLRAILRLILGAACASALLPAWTMSVEFPYSALPRGVWERDLAHLKEMGVTHVSLPPSGNEAQGDEVIRIVRALGLEADLEGPVADRLRPLTKSHGGPLSDLPASAVRVSAIMPRALDNERKLLGAGTQAIIWTDVFETLNPGYRPGAITLAGAEGAGAALIRREAGLARFWGAAMAELPEYPGARLAVPAEGISVHQFVAGKSLAFPAGLSLVAVSNDSPDAWKGEVHVLYPALQRAIALPSVAVASHDVLWLPVNIPLTEGPYCSGCNGFAPANHVAYATAELTDMEYENGILAMEFIATEPGEVVLQLSHEPPGPLIAAGRPSVFDWDPKTQRARLPIPAGNAATGRVRIALAVDAPPATAFFSNASVLIIGEANRLSAQFSPAAVAERSRVRTGSDLTIAQQPAAPEPGVPPPEDADQPAIVAYTISVPATAVAGDIAQLSIEADGMQLSHSQLRVLPPVAVDFPDAVAVRVAANSTVPLSPATIPVNQKSGRDVVVSLRNNAPEIRSFEVSLSVPGLEFSPERMTVRVGASVARNVTFRVFSSEAAAGVHEGSIRISGAAALDTPVRFVVLPPEGAVPWTAEGFSVLESAKLRASFLADRWLEMLDKESGHDALPAGGRVFTGGKVDSLKMEDLTALLPASRQ